MKQEPEITASMPSVVVKLPRALLDLFPEADEEVEIKAATVEDMIAVLDGYWPGMRDRLCDSTPRIRKHLNIFVEGRRSTLATALPDRGKVYILTAMSGG